MITPDEITKKAVKLYPKYLKSWVKGEAEDFFPRPIRANTKLDKNDMAGNIRTINLLSEKSKNGHRRGYTIRWKHVRSPIKGHGRQPEGIEIETLADLQKLARPKYPFRVTQDVVRDIREELPELNDWLSEHVCTVARYSENTEGLIAVTKYFQAKPFPDCYARQIPVDVHTKFIEDNKAVLRQWLDILLPDSAIDVNEETFALRFGLRDNQPHRALRVLDPQLLVELKLQFDEFSAPIRLLATLPVRETTVVIVENQLLLLTLPALPRTLVIRGEGDAVTRLQKLKWLNSNKIIYWGDMDVDGFQILSSLRNLFSHVESIMMDRATLEAQKDRTGDGNSCVLTEPSNLTTEEALAFRKCLKDNLRLEQERIPQCYVDKAFQELLGECEAK